MKNKKILNWISAVAVISAITLSASFVSKRINDYNNMSKAVSSTVSFVEASLPEKETPKKYEQIIEEKRKSAPVYENIPIKEPLYMKPASGKIITAYNDSEISYKDETGDYRTHSGIDILTEGNGVLSIADGVVYDIYEDANNYYVLIIKHDEINSIYKNFIVNSDITTGKNIKKGDILGKGVISEKHGEYLHFEIEKDGKKDNPIKYFE